MPERRLFRFALQQLALDDAGLIATAARRAEVLGYDELFTFDHLGAVDPFVPLVVAAAATTTLRLGPLVLNNELHHPVLLARTAATVDRMTGGRLVLGIGTGYAQAEHDAAGIPLRPPGPRVDRLRECVGAVRSLLDDGRFHADGDHHQIHVDDLGVRPMQPRVPLLIGGHGRRVVRLAGEHADIFQFTGLEHGPDGRLIPAGFAPDAVERRARWLDEATADRADPPERSVLVQQTVVGDRSVVAAGRAALIASYGMDEAFIDATPFVLAGSVEQIIDELETRRERLGISHVVVRDAEGFAPVVDALRGR
jgi:probable F420-dependent oxidoreductase